MRVLIDENLPRKIAWHFKGHQCKTVAECGWAGLKNGAILTAAEGSFDVLITLGKNIPYQQDLNSGTVAVLVLCARSNPLADLLPIVPKSLTALASIQPRQVIRVGAL